MAEYSETNYYEVQIDDIAAGGGYGDMQDYMNDMAALANMTFGNAERAAASADRADAAKDVLVDLESGIAPAVDEWLDEHPEATTTVEDRSLTRVKFSAELEKEIAFKDKYKIVTVASEKRAMCTAIIDCDGNAVLFDLSDETNGAKVIDDLTTAGVANISAVVISHYHHDHLGDYSTIFGNGGLPHNGVKFFIPDPPALGYTSQAFVDTYNAFESWLRVNAISFRTPSENETVWINNVALTFNNTDTSYWYDNYTAETFDYNWTSMCTYVEFASVSMQFMGDATLDCQDYFYSTLKAARKVNILNAVHHGYHTYVNRDFLEVCSPDVVINNYGTSNDYLSMREWASGVVDYCNSVGIPVFDTTDNGTFEIDVTNGQLEYEGLTPCVFAGNFIHYPSINDLNRYTKADLNYQTSTLEDILQGMPINSSVTFLCYDTYAIATELSIPNRSCVNITKYVGTSYNYQINSSNPNDFAFVVEIHTSFSAQNETIVINGRYVNSTYIRSVDQYVPKSFIDFHLMKSAAGDTQYHYSVNGDKTSVGFNYGVSNQYFTVARTGIYKATLTPNANSPTLIAFTLNSEKFWSANGASCSRNIKLSSGVQYTFPTSDSNTNSAELFIELIGTGTNIVLPNA